MNILALDTSTGTCSIALVSGEKTYQVSETEPASQAEKLFSLIAALLQQAGLSYPALDSIAVTTGPGSFTGVRIGLAAAKGIALAAGLPLIGISTLEAIAWDAARLNPQNLPILAVLDARRGQLYAQYFSADCTPLLPATLLSIQDIATYTPEEPCIIAGNGIAVIDAMPNAIPLKEITIPRAAIIALAAQKKQQNGNATEPFYIREPDAKVKSKASTPAPSSAHNSQS